MNKTIIILTTPEGKREAWTNLKKACRYYDLSYNAIAKKQMPCEYRGYKFERLDIH